MSTKFAANPSLTRNGVKGYRLTRLLLPLAFLLPTALSAQVHDSPPSVVAPLSGGAIQGKVLDTTGASLSGAKVQLTGNRTGAAYNTQTDSAGVYSFKSLQPDEFALTVSAQGFEPFTMSQVTLASGQIQELSPIVLHLPAVASTVEVVASRHDVAEAQMKSEEQQRLLGFVPNYYVSYFPDPVPLSAGQKMRMAFRLAIDPVNVALDAAQAGFETNSKDFRDYGTGASGFGKRFAAAYVDDAAGTMIGSGLLPALLHQDPRYYYRGTGTVSSRVLYALSWSFRCKGDNGKWQPNYSSLLGNAAGAGLSELYLPKAIRDNDLQIVKYSLLGLASQGATALLQEFVFKRLTSHAGAPGKEPKP
jgi:hypothetical protein